MGWFRLLYNDSLIQSQIVLAKTVQNRYKTPQSQQPFRPKWNVEFSRKAATPWSAAQVKDVFHPGDKLRTGSRSRAALLWSELGTVRVSELTSMEIAPPAKPTDKPQLDLRSGAAYFFSRERP